MNQKRTGSFELWSTAHDWLHACGNKDVSRNFCKEEITTHPDYPSLLSLIDFLDIGGFEYNAIQADASGIEEFTYPLLAHIQEPGNNRLEMISSPRDWDPEIAGYWSGITIFPETGARWQNELNDRHRLNEKRNTILAVAFGVLGILTLLFSTLHLYSFPSGAVNPTFIAAFGVLSLAGLGISISSLGLELGFQNEWVKQVCSTVSKGGCENVLKSKYAKGLAGITPADASTAYFTAQLVICLAGCWDPPLLEAAAVFALPGTLIGALSLYMQAVVLREWCALCLALVGVLLAQSTLAVFNLPAMNGPLPELAFLGIFLFGLLCLMPIKQLIKTNTANKYQLQELKKWKLDGGLFFDQWQQGRQIDATVWPNDLLLGDPDAPLQLTVACNPYCAPCARAHVRLDELLLHYGGKIKVQMRLLCNADVATDKRTVATRAILERASATTDSRQKQEMLSDWFEWMNYEKWTRKWQPVSGNGEEAMAAEQILRHTHWIKQSEIAATPTFFLNGRKMPGRYSLSDIGVLIPQLKDLIH